MIGNNTLLILFVLTEIISENKKKSNLCGNKWVNENTRNIQMFTI